MVAALFLWGLLARLGKNFLRAGPLLRLEGEGRVREME